MATMVRFLLLYICVFSVSAMAQTLTLVSQFDQYQKFTPVTAQFPGFIRAMRADIHEASGKQVYVWTEPDVSGSLNRDVYCAILDKDMNTLVNAFRVNNTTTNQQYFQNVQIHQSDNSFVIVWGGMQNGNWDIYAKKIRLDITDAQTTAEVTNAADLLVNISTAGDQFYPSFVINTRSNEVIVGFTTTGVNGTKEVNYQRLNMNPLGTPLTRVSGSTDQQVNTVVAGDQGMSLSMDYNQSTAQTIFTYQSKNPATNTYDILSRALNYDDATGVYSLNTEITVNTYTTGDQQNPYIKVNQQTGQYAICWQSLDQTASSGWDAYAKIFNASNTEIKSEFVIGSAAAQSQGQTYPKAVWDEYSNVLSFYFLNHSNPNSVIRARMFDGNNAYSAITAGDLDPLNGLNITNNVYSYWWPMIHQKSHNVYLPFDIYNAGSVSTYSRVAKFKYSHPSFNPPLSSNNNTMNWTDTKSFNAYGDVVSESRVFYDNRGKELQTQSFNAENPGKVFAQMPLYDYLDRPTMQTLPAVTNTTGSFSYNLIFTLAYYSSQSGYIPYTPASWDGTSTTMNPNSFYPGCPLASYYNSNNTHETGVPNTNYPFSRTFLNDAAPGGVIKQAGPGDAQRMGQGHETKSITLGVLNELDHYAMLRKTHFINDAVTTTMKQKASKQIIIDENGMSGISFTDFSGNTIATAKEGTTSLLPNAIVTSGIQLTPNIYYSNFPYYLSGTGWNMSNLRVFGTANVEIINMYDGAILYPMGPPSLVPEITYAGTVTQIQVRCAEPFRVKMLCKYNGNTSNPPADYWARYDAVYQQGQNSIDLHLQANHALMSTISNASGAKIEIQDLTTGNVVYSGAGAGYSFSSLVAGFYRIRFTGMNYDEFYNTSSITLSYKQYYTNWAYYFYDDANRMVAKTAPNGISSLTDYSIPFTDQYKYSASGQLLYSSEVDAGITNYVYTKDGKVRFTQNADQAANGRFSFVNYDAYNRTVMSGEYKKTLDGAPLSFVTQKQSDISGTEDNVISILEDKQEMNNGGLVSLSYLLDYNNVEYSSINVYNLVNSAGATRQSRNVWNQVSLTSNKAGYTTAYSYDNDGNLEWMAQTFPGLGSKTIDYVYDANHQLLQSIYQKNDASDRFDHIYTYDKIGRLKTASTREANGVVKLQEKYIYYLHGPLKRKELAGNLQGIDYVYTIQGWLKGINHPELNTAKDPGKDGASGTPNAGFAPDVFGMGLDYYNGDYSNANVTYLAATNISQGQLYNGTIQSATWGTKDHLNAGNPFQYVYQYDNKYQLTSANFGYRNTAANTNVGIATNTVGVGYDPNGNIKWKATSKSTDPSFSYAYYYNPATFPVQPVSTNKLYRLSDYTSVRTYAYNAIGQMTQQTEGDGKAKKVKYNAYGQVTEVRDEANLLDALYEYNEKGQKVKKTSYTNTGVESYVTWYVSDASGSLLSIYDTKSATLQQSEIPVYGAARIGVVYKNGSTATFTYELKDYLGNVRATIKRNKKGDGSADILGWADYLPFGEVMPDRHGETVGLTSRFGYQGDYCEKEDETGWNDFDLRMYDPAIGRWLSRDPYNQYHSPYVGMGNNPINMVDPDGGKDGPPVASAKANPGAVMQGATPQSNGKFTDYISLDDVWIRLADEILVDPNVRVLTPVTDYDSYWENGGWFKSAQNMFESYVYAPIGGYVFYSSGGTLQLYDEQPRPESLVSVQVLVDPRDVMAGASVGRASGSGVWDAALNFNSATDDLVGFWGRGKTILDNNPRHKSDTIGVLLHYHADSARSIYGLDSGKIFIRSNTFWGGDTWNTK